MAISSQGRYSGLDVDICKAIASAVLGDPWGFGAINWQIWSALAAAGGDLPLSEPFKGAILPSKPPGIWRMRDRAEGAQ